MKQTINALTWREFTWVRQFEAEDVINLLTHIAANRPGIPVIYEVRGYRGKVRFFVGTDYQYMPMLAHIFKAHGDVRFAEIPMSARPFVNTAQKLKITKQILALRTDVYDMVVQAGLAALAQSRGDEQTVLQIVMGAAHHPAPVPQHIPDPHASLLEVMFGEVEPAGTDSRNVVKEKLSCPNFDVVVRMGATGAAEAAKGRILGLFSAFRALQSAGVSIQTTEEDPHSLNYADIPRHFPLRLSVKELANFLLLPTGDTELPGVAGLHPRQVMPPAWYRNPRPAHARTFAMSLDNRHRLDISPKDSLTHTLLFGSTGAGKSTVMQHLALSDIHANRGLIFCDPKYEQVENIAARIPERRVDDTVILDATAAAPVGVNPLAYKGHNPALMADTILAVLKEIYKDSWGVFTEDVLSAALHTLIRVKGATLLWLAPLLTDEDFRNRITAVAKNDVALAPFWKMFAELGDPERRKMIAPIMNKLRQWLIRPELRNVLGQAEPKFDLMDVFTKRRIVLMPLNKNINGESSRLLGSLVIGLVINMALSRAALPENRRHLVGLYVDELYDYISSISADFNGILAEARGLGLGICMAHQFRHQLSNEVAAGIDANARNKIVFRLESPTDARAIAAMAPNLTPDDFMSLPLYHVYASVYQGGRNTGWVSGRTLPMTRPFRNPADLKRKVAALYGKPGREVEREYAELLAACRAGNKPETGSALVGRRAKT
jgi:energy-coupling factor transporter ATP-binding protein EcfA2